MEHSEYTVIYIVADNRSGSTLLDYLLGCHPEAITLGEMHHLSDYIEKRGFGSRNDWKCSCGVHVEVCTFWKEVLSKLNIPDSFETRLPYREPRWAFLSKKMQEKSINTLLQQSVACNQAKVVAQNCWAVYSIVNQISKKRIIIDSSKKGVEAYFLGKYKKCNIKYILLERDIRAVAYSKFRRERLNLGHQTRKNTPLKSIFVHLINSLRVIRRNRVFMKKIRSFSNKNDILTINYSDLVKKPEDTVKNIWKFFGMPTSTLVPLVTSIKTNQLHVLHGSPSRYDKKPIRDDLKWKRFYDDKPFAKMFGDILHVLAKK